MATQRDSFTDDEMGKLVTLGDSFWYAFGVLAAKHIAQMPQELEGAVTAYLQDKCSIYGSLYAKHLPPFREKLGTM